MLEVALLLKLAHEEVLTSVFVLVSGIVFSRSNGSIIQCLRALKRSKVL